MAKCETCPLYAGITAANEVTNAFELDTIDSANKDAVELQKRTQMYARLFEAVEKNITCHYNPNPVQPEQAEIADNTDSDDQELANSDKSTEQLARFILQSKQQAPQACEAPFQVALRAITQGNNEIRVYPTGHNDSVQNRQAAIAHPNTDGAGLGQYL